MSVSGKNPQTIEKMSQQITLEKVDTLMLQI